MEEAQAAGLKLILDLHAYPHGGEIGDTDRTLARPDLFDRHLQALGGDGAAGRDGPRPHGPGSDKRADRNGSPRRRMVPGEFGALWRGPSGETTGVLAEHAAFLSTKVRAVEGAGMGWAVWSFTGAFAITGPDQALDPASVGRRGCRDTAPPPVRHPDPRPGNADFAPAAF